MAALVKKYRIGKNRLAQGLLKGFSLSDSGELRASGEASRRLVYLGALDGVQPDFAWGRLVFEAELGDGMALGVRIFASNEARFVRKGVLTEVDDFLLDESVGEEPKAALFLAAGCLEAVGVTDLLLNGLSGRYLWISVEVLGMGNAVLKNFRVYSPEDNFFNSFPEVYRTDGDFFRRYLSIFNVMYADFQEKIDALDQYLDLDTAPTALLPVFAHWLGLELDGNFLDDSQLRILLKNAFSLICAKGTRKAIVGVVRILTDAPVYVLERQSSQGKEAPYDFTVLLQCVPDERLYSQLKFLINQFKPLRSRVSLVFLDNCGRLDSFACLDLNAAVSEPEPGRADKGAALNGLVCLQ